MSKGFLSLLLICFTYNAVAQKSNEREKWVKGVENNVILDSLTVVPGTITVLDSLLKADIEYDIESGEVSITTAHPVDSFLVRYKVFPYAMHSKVYHKTLEEYDSAAFFKSPGRQRSVYLNERREELFATPNLYKSGVISRGITFGNRQDIFVNSVLNLQLDGKLSEKLNIRASITDQNIPYQPEGNTKLVQDFDNVFFEIYNDAFSISGGDIVLQNTRSNFLRYYRNVQGARLGGRYRVGEHMQVESALAVSVSKGKFATYRIEVLDGIMGPYKLYGPDNEKFIIIQANSERVYLDGRLLERGFNNHYVIDYNTAEITFTSKVMITKFSRVQVDFEYTNQAYSRTVVAASQQQSIKNLEISVDFYQEKDNPNQPLTFELSDLEKELLSVADLEKGNAVIPGWDSIGYSDNLVLYKKMDTLGLQGEQYTIFIFSTDPDSAFYQVFFTEVPSGQGDYTRKSAGTNGRVYEWVEPVDGRSRGNYVPMRVIPLPNKKQMLTINSAYKIGKDDRVFSEVAFSSHDDNLYNREGGGINGIAFKTGYIARDKSIGFLPGYAFTGQVDYEYNSKGFRGIDRFRTVEYDRDWSYNPQLKDAPASDHILNAIMGIKKDNTNFMELGTSRRVKSGAVNGWQASSDGMYDMKRLNIQTRFFFLDSDNGPHHSDWLRFMVSTYYKSRIFFPGYEYRVERNVISDIVSDSVAYSSDNFEEHRFFIRSNDTLKTFFNINYSIRKDRLPVFGEMIDRNLSRTGNIIMGTKDGKLGKFDLNLTYRELGYLGDDDLPDLRSLLGRIDWSAALFSKHIRSELMYAIGNGRELRREYVFIPVPTGEGTHTWRDDNQDGRQDLDEFYLAVNNDERNYIKLFTPTDDYVLAYDNQLNYRVSADMPRSWKSETGIRKFLGKFSNNLHISIKQKTADDRFIDNLLFDHNVMESDKLLSYRDNIRNNLYFNRADPRYGFELIYQRMKNKQLLSSGFEARNTTLLRGVSRVNINRDYSLRISAGGSSLGNSSDFMAKRNYFILSRMIGGSFEWQPSNNVRITTEYNLCRNRNEQNPDAEEEASTINEALLNFKFSKAANKNIDLSIRYTHIAFEGTENSAVGYELLKALQPGQNLSWTLGWQQKLFNGLQVNVFYEGRKSGDLDVIHIGRMQVMALF